MKWSDAKADGIIIQFYVLRIIGISLQVQENLVRNWNLYLVFLSFIFFTYLLYCFQCSSKLFKKFNFLQYIIPRTLLPTYRRYTFLTLFSCDHSYCDMSPFFKIITKQIFVIISVIATQHCVLKSFVYYVTIVNLSFVCWQLSKAYFFQDRVFTTLFLERCEFVCMHCHYSTTCCAWQVE